MKRFFVISPAVVLSVALFAVNGCSKSNESNKEGSMSESGVAELIKNDVVVGEVGTLSFVHYREMIPSPQPSPGGRGSIWKTNNPN